MMGAGDVRLSIVSAWEIAIKEGMRTLFQSGMERVIHGQTTVEEVLRMVAMDQF